MLTRRLPYLFREIGAQEEELSKTNRAEIWSEPDRDGFRNVGVNVCHILNIDCCVNCDKNSPEHKHSGVEFRAFDLEVKRTPGPIPTGPLT